MTTRFTRARTISWNSCSTVVMVFALVQTAASPRSTETTRADMTGMIWGMSSWKATSGSSRRAFVSETIFRCGMIAYPAPAESRDDRRLER